MQLFEIKNVHDCANDTVIHQKTRLAISGKIKIDSS